MRVSPGVRACSSVVELWFYTPAVGGSKPSAPTKAPHLRVQVRGFFVPQISVGSARADSFRTAYELMTASRARSSALATVSRSSSNSSAYTSKVSAADS